VNIRFLETFVWLAKLQNFRLTAQKLHTTQAAVSARIASLEEDFGTPLFFRNSRSASLTPAGRSLLTYAERIVWLGDDMRRQIDGRDVGMGLLRIGVVESVVYSLFPMLKSLIAERYPDLVIETTSDTAAQLGRLLGNDEVDLVLRTDATNLPDFENLPLCDMAERWMAHPALGLGGRPVGLREITGHPIISAARHSRQHSAMERAFAPISERPAHINCVSSVGAVIRMVSDGLGVTALPPLFVQRELQSGLLEQLDVDTELPPLPFFASYKEQGLPIAARVATLAREAAINFLAEQPVPGATPSADAHAQALG
jgi:DNA-binding transcriptional LysR family regulator